MNRPSRSLLLAVLVGLGAAGCGGRPAATQAARTDGGDPQARARAADWLRTARFEDADPAIDCRPDCREQERGFNYARSRRIERPGDCDLTRVEARASEDFIEGCRAYGQYLEAAERGR